MADTEDRDVFKISETALPSPAEVFAKEPDAAFEYDVHNLQGMVDDFARKYGHPELVAQLHLAAGRHNCFFIAGSEPTKNEPST